MAQTAVIKSRVLLGLALGYFGLIAIGVGLAAGPLSPQPEQLFGASSPPPKPIPQPPPNKCDTPEDFIAALRTIPDWSEFANNTADPFVKTSIADETIPLLIELLNDPDLQIRVRALSTLGKIRRHADVIVPALIPFLNDEHPGIRWHAACSLGMFRGDAAAAIPALTAQLNDDESPIAVFSAVILLEIDDTVPIEGRLIELLPQQNMLNRSRAVDALADLGTPTARDALFAAFQTETDQQMRDQLAQAINRVDSSDFKNTADEGIGAESR